MARAIPTIMAVNCHVIRSHQPLFAALQFDRLTISEVAPFPLGEYMASQVIRLAPESADAVAGAKSEALDTTSTALSARIRITRVMDFSSELRPALTRKARQVEWFLSRRLAGG